jgi:Tfp pilus assembly protein PilE
MRRRPDARSGLTLAELLIALAITAMALGVATEGVRRVMSFQSGLDERRLLRDEVGAGLAALRVRLERSLAVSREAADEESEEFLFQGGTDGFRFVSADPGYPSQAGLYEYRVALAEGGGRANEGAGLSLSRRRLTALEDFAAHEEGFETWPLVERSAEWRFAYGGEDNDWQEAWAPGGGMPYAVAIYVEEDGPPVLLQLLGAPRPGLPDEEEDGEMGEDGELDDGRGDGGEGGRRRNGNGREPNGREDPGDRGGSDQDGAG